MTSASVQPRGAGARTVAAAESEIERDYARLETEVLGTVRAKLAATGVPIDHDGLGGAYNQAWHALYAARVAGETIDNRTGFLVQVTYRRALDERRAARRELALDPLDEAVGVEHDMESELDDRLQVRALMQGMRERLDERELHAATLCYVHGYTRPEAASALGVRPRRFEKVMDRVSKELTGLVGDLRAGEWCDSRRSLISAYALGVLDADGERYRLATAHLEDCPACRRRVACMRGLAAVAPPVPLLLGAAAGGGVGAGAAGGSLAERWEWLARLRGHGTEVVAGGAAVAAATSAIVVFGPPADWGSSADGGASTAAQAAAPLTASAVAAPRAAATGSVARAKAEARRRERQRRRIERGADRPAASTPAQPAGEATPAAPAPAAPAPSTPTAPPSPAAPADDGWEEFELRR